MRWFALTSGAAVVVLFISTGGAAADDIAVDNHLSACIALAQKGISTLDNLVVLDARLVIKRPIGECGCFSASMTYTSFLNQGRAKEVLQQGQINTLQAGARKLVLSSSPGLSPETPMNMELLNLELACTPPL
jgi:hypothetical protein